MNNILKNKSNSKEVRSMKKKGFTLIELIAVIAILGILAVVLIPNIIGYTNKAKISKAQSDAGIIVRAIDTYEAETSEADPTTTLVSQSPTAGGKKESAMTLAALVTADATSNLIFGTEAPVKAVPNEFTSDGKGGGDVCNVTIENLRKIATRSLPITIDNANGGRVIGTGVGY